MVRNWSMRVKPLSYWLAQINDKNADRSYAAQALGFIGPEAKAAVPAR